MRVDELKKIARNNRNMERIANKYRELSGGIGIPAMQSDGMPHGNSKQSGMPAIEEMIDLEIEYKALYAENELLIRKARKYIDEIPDQKIRTVLTLTYINNLDEIEIAGEAGISTKAVREILKVHACNVF